MNGKVIVWRFSLLKFFLKCFESSSVLQEEHRFLDEDDLKHIIVPFSVEYTESSTEELVYHIIGRRETPSDYSDWPNCYAHYTGDKGERMINEFLYFLECFDFLRSNSTNTRGADKKYFATNKLTKLFGTDSSSIGIQSYNEQTKKNQIFFGAPGTGKSYRVKKRTKSAEDADRVFRTTFHPDYDHSSFVGSYKPTKSAVLDETGARSHFNSKFHMNSFLGFTKAYVDSWNNLDKDYYLIIEEINRGNCAEIFGDLFQLLDRDDDGYPIIPSKELNDFLFDELNNPEEDGLKAGKLQLPPNLNILATMNTSDQSLFPMDSAFKRRWIGSMFLSNMMNYQDSERKMNHTNTLLKARHRIYRLDGLTLLTRLTSVSALFLTWEKINKLETISLKVENLVANL